MLHLQWIQLQTFVHRHVHNSIVVHVVWLVVAICLGFVVRNQFKDKIKFIKFVINVFLITSVTVVVFDVSMAIIYIVHIQKSITYNMVIRHAGWSLNLKASHPGGFGGWLVIAASICWLRGLFFTALNIYFCNVINRIRFRILKKEVRSRMMRQENLPFPEAASENIVFYNSLYYRSGESRPFYVYSNDFGF